MGKLRDELMIGKLGTIFTFETSPHANRHTMVYNNKKNIYYIYNDDRKEYVTTYDVELAYSSFFKDISTGWKILR